ncbi:class I SAM-dependent methyltransferase [Fodinicola acaciae]|uniref:class I SAM-dependent methyltransferase n=1 Tax=Fodinicola acaciae TaxID=2681555 RepID=UPI0013CF9B75|nr:class I SAM-dependent methyltransferase [Fodinicola acaciae]
MDLGFSDEVVDLYHRYRRGYPAPVIATIAKAFGLAADDVVIDIGCGTGQLTLPLARRVRAAVGVDPEPDMLARARQTAHEQGVTNISWMLAADADLPAFGTLVGKHRLAAATIGQALHWMTPETLFHDVAPLLRPGGGVAVVTNGTPLWLQQTSWSKALRHVLEQWLEEPATDPCGTDEASQHRYANALAAAGMHVNRATVNYTDELNLDQVIGGVLSAFSAEQLPRADQRDTFAQRVRDALAPHQRFSEHVQVTVLTGIVGNP